MEVAGRRRVEDQLSASGGNRTGSRFVFHELLQKWHAADERARCGFVPVILSPLQNGLVTLLVRVR